MNSIAVNDFGSAGSNLLKARLESGQLNCHVSPVIYQIRDHGPAMVDGEVYKDSTAAALPGKPKTAPAVEPAAVPAASEPAVAQLPDTQVPNRGAYKAMIFSIVLLTIALASVSFYAWQQKLHVDDLQAELKIYDDLDQGI